MVLGNIGLHRDLAASAVVDRVDGAVVTHAEGDVEWLDPEDEIPGDMALQGLERQLTLLGGLAQKWIDLATKGGDGPVSVADMGSLGVPVVGVLGLHQGSKLLFEGLDDLGSAGRRGGHVAAQEVRGARDFEEHAVEYCNVGCCSESVVEEAVCMCVCVCVCSEAEQSSTAKQFSGVSLGWGV